MRGIFISILLIFFSTVTVEGSDWELVTQDDAGRWYVDKHSIKHISDNVVEATVKIEYLKPSLLPAPGGRNKLDEMIIWYQYDCKESKQRILWRKLYYDNGDKTMSKWTIDEFSDIVPDSTEDKIHKYVCKQSKSAEK